MAQASSIVRHPPAALEQSLERLGRNIRTARLRRGWRLEDVAKRMGVTRYTVSNIGRARQAPPWLPMSGRSGLSVCSIRCPSWLIRIGIRRARRWRVSAAQSGPPVQSPNG